MTSGQWRIALQRACKHTYFKPTTRTDIQSIGHSRFYDGWIEDVRTGKIYSTGMIDFAQTPEKGEIEIREKLARLEARISEMSQAEERNRTRRVNE